MAHHSENLKWSSWSDSGRVLIWWPKDRSQKRHCGCAGGWGSPRSRAKRTWRWLQWGSGHMKQYSDHITGMEIWKHPTIILYLLPLTNLLYMKR